MGWTIHPCSQTRCDYRHSVTQGARANPKPSMRQSRFLTTNDGAELHYVEAGNGEPLLFIHGAGLSAELFAAQIDHFSDGR